jgi:hypothetical protein
VFTETVRNEDVVATPVTLTFERPEAFAARRAAVVALLTLGPAAHGGTQLTVERLVARSDAVVLVRVGLGRTTTVTLREVIRSDIAPGLPSAGRLTGVCLPDRRLLDDWIVRPSVFEKSVPLWRAVLKRGGYEAVVFLRRDPDVLRPTCETETMLAEHWTTHPSYRAWRSGLTDALAKRAP